MTQPVVRFRHKYGDRSCPTWGQTYDELSLYQRDGITIVRSEFDTLVQESTTLIACQSSTARNLANSFMSEFQSRGGTGMGEISALELIAKVGMLLNEIYSNPK